MTPDRDKLSDHDLLICMDVKMTELRTQMDNHLAHHWAVELAMAAALITALAAIVLK